LPSPKSAGSKTVSSASTGSDSPSETEDGGRTSVPAFGFLLRRPLWGFGVPEVELSAEGDEDFAYLALSFDLTVEEMVFFCSFCEKNALS
jgi:hypothetical protein